MMPFHEGYMPIPESAWISGGPERRTEIVALASGREERNAVWRHGRRRYEVGEAFASPDARALLVAFFEARRGRLQGFRFRDPYDCKSCAPTLQPAATDMGVGVGDGAQRTFQLTRTYGEGADAYARPVRKPVASSVLIAVNGAALPSTAFAVDAATGLVTLGSPPPTGHTVTAGFIFDTPVRFESDRLDLPHGAASASLQLIEILP